MATILVTAGLLITGVGTAAAASSRSARDAQYGTTPQNQVPTPTQGVAGTSTTVTTPMPNPTVSTATQAPTPTVTATTRTPTPTPTVTQTTQPTATTANSVTTPQQSSSGQLPFTGMDVLVVLGVGLVLVAAGFILRSLSSQRRGA